MFVGAFNADQRFGGARTLSHASRGMACPGPLQFRVASGRTGARTVISMDALDSGALEAFHAAVPTFTGDEPWRHLYVHTPLIESAYLSARVGRRVLLKLDAVQPSGSFKIRGMSEVARSAKQSGQTLLVSSSGGNAGMAAAYAARKSGLRAHIFVPSTTPQMMRDRIADEGAVVQVHGSVWDEAHGAAVEMVQRLGPSIAKLVSPFDDPILWRGHASLVDELHKDLHGEAPAAIIASVGGGGLFMGILEGLDARGKAWDQVVAVAVETSGADSFAQSFKSGTLVSLPAITSVASSLGAKTVSRTLFNRCCSLEGDKRGAANLQRPIKSVVLDDRDAIRACLEFAVQQRLLVEPACGVAIAAVERVARELGNSESNRPIVVVVCGGNIISPGMLQSYARKFELETKSWM
ncbi:L-serine dehydratase/L-threonine deaminase [Porphyridium purpureum]|uniref:L-serine ammonia-lyase n=1 Tax=Porphyridium purpureum TaxID=35688 RepID=A0A5J4YWY2_PORPP|nr:L-serine dehydratase/L-threonine deaminase [Porphyridium purpureum]|eukprot:POR4880..scf209_3